jgi:hypothetical protein
MTADDWVKLIGAAAGGLVVVLGAIGALYVKIHQVGTAVNGRLSQLLSVTSAAAKAEGMLEVQSGTPAETATGEATSSAVGSTGPGSTQ